MLHFGLSHAARAIFSTFLFVLAFALVGGLRAQEEEQSGHDMSAMEEPVSEEMAMEGMDHGDHQMMPEDYKTLREKIPLYREFSDQQIDENMGSMAPSYDVYVSGASVQGDVGILFLGHGFHEPGDSQFKEALTPIAENYPTAIGYGMAMMTSAHIQSAVDNLTAAGAKTIVLVYTSFTAESNLVTQWEYIFGHQDESAYLNVPRVTTEAKLLIAPSQSESLIIADLMLDHAKEMSTDPDNELLIVASHGPTDPVLNIKELQILEGYAKHMEEGSDFTGIKVITLQDDAPSEVRAANVARFRGWVEDAAAEGKRVLVVANLLTTGSVHRKIKRDLDGLEYEFSTTGLMQHPGFQNWINHAIETALAEG